MWKKLINFYLFDDKWYNEETQEMTSRVEVIMALADIDDDE